MDKIEGFDRSADGEEEDNVLDFTAQPENPRGNIRLKEGFEVQDILQHKGIMLEPEEFDDNALLEENSKIYFSRNDQDLEEMMKHHGLDSDEDAQIGLAKKVIDLTGDGGVKKRLIAAGLEADGHVPEKGSVTIHYSLTIEGQDEPFDSTYLRGKCERHRLDDNRLIPGLSIAVRSMKNHEKSEFIIGPEYAFGAMGCPPRVPASSMILARIELLNFAEEGEAEAMLSMPSDERNKTYKFEDVLKVVQKEHRTGNSYFGKDEYKSAAKCYERACKLLDELELANDEEEQKQTHLLLKFYNNRGLCYTRINWPKKACLVLQDALKIDETNAKANYRLGVAKRMLCHYDAARKYLMKALQVKPGNAEIGAELSAVDLLIKKERDDQKMMCARMFNNKSQSNNEKLPSSNGSKLEDEDYAEIVEQLEEFQMDKKQKELVLPSGFDPSIIRMIEDIASRKDLSVVPGKFADQYKVVKKS